MKSVLAGTLTILTLCFFASCDKKSNDETLTIAVAANVQYAIDPILSSFTAATGISCQKVIGSSGKLSALISQGAPYDVFLSADMRYPHDLYKKGLALSPPTTYALGQLVIWSHDKNQDLTLPSLQELEYVAIANPDVAPYGKAAIQTFESVGLSADLKSKLVYGESVSQAAQFALTGVAQVAMISRSLAMSPNMRDQGKWADVDQGLHRPIDQGAIVVAQDDHQVKIAATFVKYLLTPEMQLLLRDAGYMGITDTQNHK